MLALVAAEYNFMWVEFSSNSEWYNSDIPPRKTDKKSKMDILGYILKYQYISPTKSYFRDNITRLISPEIFLA